MVRAYATPANDDRLVPGIEIPAKICKVPTELKNHSDYISFPFNTPKDPVRNRK